MDAQESRGKFGTLILQHHGWRDQNLQVEERSCILATRVLKRDVDYVDGQLATGGYDLDRFATGDLTNVLAWPGLNDTGGRYIAGFSWAWAAVVTDRRPSTNQQTPPPKSTPAPDAGAQQADPEPPLADKSSGQASSYPPRQTDPTDDSAGGRKDTSQDEPADFYVLPIRNDKFEEDIRYEPIRVAVMADEKGQELVSKYPPGTRGIVLAGSEENEQFPIFVPSENRLFAVNYGGNPFTGTLVADLGIDGKIDKGRMARLQSHVRVVVGPYTPEPDVERSWKAANYGQDANVLAWNLGGHAGSGYDQLTGRNDSFAGWVWMDGPSAFEGGGPHLVREEAHGPWTMGCCVKHRLAVDGDGNAIFPMHQALGTLWTYNSRYLVKAKDADNGYYNYDSVGSGAAGVCGPMLFEGAYHKPKRGVYITPVHLRFDTEATHDWFDGERHGIWRWQAESYFEEPDQPEEPPPPPPDDPGDPGEPGQPEYPGKIPPEEPDPDDPGFGFIPPVSIPELVDRARRGLPPRVYPPIGPNGPIGPVIDPDGFPWKGDPDPADGGGPAPGGSGGDIVPKTPPKKTDNTSPGRLRELGWWGSIRPGDDGLLPYQPGERNRFVATGVMTSFPGLLFRPQLFGTGQKDMRHWMTPTPEAVQAFDTEAPVVLRAEAWGAQGGTPGGPYLDTATGRQYTNKPRTARYPGGDGAGGLAFLTPQTDLSLIDEGLVAPTDESPSYILVGPNVRFAAGLPELSGGGVKSGWAWGANDAGDLVFEQFDATGASLQTVTFPPAGGSATMQAIFGQTQDATVGGTATETSIIGSGVGTLTIPADGWQEGMSTRTLLRGHISTIAPTPGAITVKGYLGGATVLTAGAGAITANLNQAYFEVEMVLTCQDLSDPANAVFTGALVFRTIGITGVPVTHYVVGTAQFSGVVDTTVDTALDVTWTWGTSSGGNTLTTKVGKTDTETPA